MRVVICNRNRTLITYGQIVALIHDSFIERLEQGLRYSCSSITVEQYIENTKKGIIFVAVNEDTNELVGTCVLNLINCKRGKHGYMEYVAISSKYKHCGIGSMLVDRIRSCGIQKGCDFILSDTSTKAISAVTFHQKNGFKIIGLESYRSTNYWSYVFRMQLKPSFMWNNPLLLKLHYLGSYVFIKATRDINGNDTSFGTFYKKMRGLCKN